MSGSEEMQLEYARVCVEMAASVEDVWRVVSAFGGVERWIAGADTCALDGEGVGAVRTIGLAGRSVRERLDRLDPARHSVTYSILPPHSLPASDVRGTITLRDAGAKLTEFTWVSDASHIDGDAAALRARVEAFYRASIDKLSRLLADY